jgi:hypothetical protein
MGSAITVAHITLIARIDDRLAGTSKFSATGQNKQKMHQSIFKQVMPQTVECGLQYLSMGF